MDSKSWRVLIVSTVAGIISFCIINLLMRYIIINISHEQINLYNRLLSLFTVFLFACACIFCFKDMTKKEILKSASIFCAYFLFVRIFSLIFDGYTNNSLELFYNLQWLSRIRIILSIPIIIYSNIYQSLLRFIPMDNMNLPGWIVTAMSLLAVPIPLLYTVCARSKHTV